jgi:hypothetical protein
MAVCAAGSSGVGPGVKRRFLCSIGKYFLVPKNLFLY